MRAGREGTSAVGKAPAWPPPVPSCAASRLRGGGRVDTPAAQPHRCIPMITHPHPCPSPGGSHGAQVKLGHPNCPALRVSHARFPRRAAAGHLNFYISHLSPALTPSLLQESTAASLRRALRCCRKFRQPGRRAPARAGMGWDGWMDGWDGIAAAQQPSQWSACPQYTWLAPSPAGCATGQVEQGHGQEAAPGAARPTAMLWLLLLQLAHLAGGQGVASAGQVAQGDGQGLGIQELERRQHLAQLPLGCHENLRYHREGREPKVVRCRGRQTNNDAPQAEGARARRRAGRVQGRGVATPRGSPAAPPRSWGLPGSTHSLQYVWSNRRRGTVRDPHGAEGKTQNPAWLQLQAPLLSPRASVSSDAARHKLACRRAGRAVDGDGGHQAQAALAADEQLLEVVAANEG